MRLYDGARFNHLQLGDLIAGADFDVVLVDNIESVRRSPEYPIGDDPLWAVGDELNRARIGCNIPLIVGCSMNTKEVWPDPLFSIPEPLEGTASVVLTLVDGHGGIQPQMVKHRNGPVVDLGFIKLRKMPGGRLVEEVS